jgi:hypothetical protein
MNIQHGPPPQLGVSCNAILGHYPKLEKNKKGQQIIKKDTVTHGPKKGKKGYLDTKGRIWIKDRAHAGDPDHWDVQEDGGKKYIRVDPQGNELP